MNNFFRGESCAAICGLILILFVILIISFYHDKCYQNILEILGNYIIFSMIILMILYSCITQKSKDEKSSLSHDKKDDKINPL